jgi:glycosyltransferase involved in cell wall biosynthesis
MLRKAGAAIGVSQPMVDALVRLGARPERAALVKNGIDKALFRPADRMNARRALGLAEQGRIALFVGDLKEEKGVLDLLAAFCRLQPERGGGKPFHLVLVGEGVLEREAQKYASQLPLRGRIRIVGPKPAADVARYLAAADVLVLPSWAEGMPNVVLESLSAARPVVATRVGGIPDVVESGRTGLLIPPRDPNALAGALHDALTRTWDERAFERSAQPSWEESGRALLEVLERAVDAGAAVEEDAP